MFVFNSLSLFQGFGATILRVVAFMSLYSVTVLTTAATAGTKKGVQVQH